MKLVRESSSGSSPEMDSDVRDLINQFLSKKSDSWLRSSLEKESGEEKEDSFSGVSLQEIERPSIQIMPPLERDVEDKGVALQKWEGVVQEVGKDIFTARLYDKTSGNIEEEAEIFVSDVPDDDLSLIEPGAVFYLSLGYIIKNTGQKIRGPIIKFRRLPAWSRRELKEIDIKARERKKLIGWGSDEETKRATGTQ